MASDPRSGADHSLERGSGQPREQVQGNGSLWQNRIPEELIEALVRMDAFVEFTDAWRDLTADEQLDLARSWLREALGLECWR